MRLFFPCACFIQLSITCFYVEAFRAQLEVCVLAVYYSFTCLSPSNFDLLWKV